MQQAKESQNYQVKVNRQIVYHHNSSSQLGQENKNSFDNNNPKQILNSISKKDSIKKQNKWNKWYLPQFVKRQLLRLVFIPLLIVLFLLTIALTFKQNNYQTNDYFYSKNIQINRKIRGVVPPLNQTKQDIFGEYKIGLLQSFTVDDRRMLQNFKVQMWRNESMRVTEIGKEDRCWSVYKLKFYSSTIFIEKKQSYFLNLSAAGNMGQKKDVMKKAENEIKKSSSESPENVSDETKSSQTDLKNQSTQAINNGSSNTQSAQMTIVDVTGQPTNSNEQNKQPVKTSQTPIKQPVCQLQKWSKLNQILGNSHIWTFAEGNFYLMQFSQLQYDNNGVLIMRMLSQYPNAI